MATTTEISSVLKDLVQINVDRYNGCQKAIEDVQDSDLKDMFRRMGEQSLNFKNELERFGGSDVHIPTDETSAASKVHRTWIDIKSAFTGKDRHSVLAAAETGEDTILKTYREALEDTSGMPTDLMQVVQRQKQELQQSHNMVKALRDSRLS
ncbi:PA2169 family four-helix-bundle protein [Ilyomonas limi]|jgi:uncharacterized protein (TIGR02284 family)|uniref:PA2169 family four-helix-bundle protein n=1 Tax=Ilyomonas limi TaxID=2575867 RepID=A0A4U3LCJ7_9BACT|nr:PA2169 family four-helix-bundle protein [Ilyomonas limi]TKK71796.1 PA2169 family four-helix-bundle protein [Ilyomonas limi]